MDSTPDRALGTLGRVRQRMNILSKDKMMERKSIYDQRVAEEAQFVNELERFHRIARNAYPSLDRYPDFMKDASKGIKHYLNGFAAQMYDWLTMFHAKTHNAVRREIEEFAIKLAQHRVTYPLPPPHYLSNQEEKPWFDAFIRMRDDNMELLQKKGMSSMISNHFVSGERYKEQEAIQKMMGIMEIIGIVIGYPGVQKMQKEGGRFKFGDLRQDVQDILEGTTDIDESPLFYGSNLVELLSRNSCIGVTETEVIMKNVRSFVRSFVRDLAHRKLVNELERFRSITQQAPNMSPDFMKDASEEIDHYLNGFDSRMSNALRIFYSKSDATVKQEIEGFAINLAHHRATYPRPPPPTMDVPSDRTVGH